MHKEKVQLQYYMYLSRKKVHESAFFVLDTFLYFLTNAHGKSTIIVQSRKKVHESAFFVLDTYLYFLPNAQRKSTIIVLLK